MHVCRCTNIILLTYIVIFIEIQNDVTWETIYILYYFLSQQPGGTSILTVTGTCRWTGYDFAVITIDTGYLNRPNWLLADFSVYHRAASQPTMFMTGSRSRYQRRCVRVATDMIVELIRAKKQWAPAIFSTAILLGTNEELLSKRG